MDQTTNQGYGAATPFWYYPRNDFFETFPINAPEESVGHTERNTSIASEPRGGRWAQQLSPSSGPSEDTPSPLMPTNMETAMIPDHITNVADLREFSPTKEFSTSGKRRAQNRAAQRAFRERKQQHVKELEQQLAELQAKYEQLESSHEELNVEYSKLKRAAGFIGQEDISDKVESLRQMLDVLENRVRKALT